MNKPKRVTMIDVAKAANVSYQTVSRVINDHPTVAPETRARVLEVIQALNYRPNKAARSLAANQTNTLAVVTYDLSYFGPTQMFVNVERAARRAGYDVLFLNVDPVAEIDIMSLTDRIAEWSVDGALLIAPVMDIQYEQVIPLLNNIPLLLLDSERGADFPSVIIDQHYGSALITQHLIELGHTRIGEISGPLNWHGALARHRGFLQVMAEHNLAPVASIAGDWSAESGYEAAKVLVENHPCTAIAAANDQMALGAMALLGERGYAIPQDISIAGFDDIPEAQFFSPALTTIYQDFSKLGQQGLALLIEMINDPACERAQRVIKPRLIVRESTAPPAGK